MKRKRQEADSPFSLIPADVLPLFVPFLVKDAAQTCAELRIWVCLQRVSQRWRFIVARQLQSDAVMLQLIPSPFVGKAPTAGWDIDHDLGDALPRLRMACCSQRLFNLLNASSWLESLREYVCDERARYYRVEREVDSLVPRQKTEKPLWFGCTVAELSACPEPHLQLAHLLLRLQLNEVTKKNVYAVARVWTESSTCGRVYVHRPAAHGKADPHVNTSEGEKIYLADLTPLMSTVRAASETCYELLVALSMEKTHLLTGQKLLQALQRNFECLWPLITKLKKRFDEMGVKKLPPERKREGIIELKVVVKKSDAATTQK